VPTDPVRSGALLCDEKLPKASPSDLVSVMTMPPATMRWIEGPEMEVAMSTTETPSTSADRLIESFHDAGNTALESVRKFLDAVDEALCEGTR